MGIWEEELSLVAARGVVEAWPFWSEFLLPMNPELDLEEFEQVLPHCWHCGWVCQLDSASLQQMLLAQYDDAGGVGQPSTPLSSGLLVDSVAVGDLPTHPFLWSPHLTQVQKEQCCTVEEVRIFDFVIDRGNKVELVVWVPFQECPLSQTAKSGALVVATP